MRYIKTRVQTVPSLRARPWTHRYYLVQPLPRQIIWATALSATVAFNREIATQRTTFFIPQFNSFLTPLSTPSSMEFLQPLENLSLPPLERAVLNVLKGVLDYPATSEARAAKIADSIVFFCTTDLDADQEIGGVFLALWDVILELVTVIPPGHDWQQTLALTLNTVRQREGTASDEHTVRFEAKGTLG